MMNLSGCDQTRLGEDVAVDKNDAKGLQAFLKAARARAAVERQASSCPHHGCLAGPVKQRDRSSSHAGKVLRAGLEELV